MAQDVAATEHSIYQAWIGRKIIALKTFDRLFGIIWNFQ